MHVGPEIAVGMCASAAVMVSAFRTGRSNGRSNYKGNWLYVCERSPDGKNALETFGAREKVLKSVWPSLFPP